MHASVAERVEDLERQLDDVTIADAHRLERRILRARKINDGTKQLAALDEVATAIATSRDRYLQRSTKIPKVTYPAELPIAQRRDEILETIRSNQVVVIAGETGSGKSTQLPKMCIEAGLGARGMIGHTQPRRIAARSVASRIAHELQVKVGGSVGHSVRFDNRTTELTNIKVMTDGIVLAELAHDPDLLAYDALIIDEAHERSLNIDFLLGYVHQLLKRRDDLKVIVTSATIDTERFSRHFGNAPIIEVSGRNHPVEIRYQPRDETGQVLDVPAAVRRAVEDLRREGPGDVLVFSSGEREINDICESLRRHEPDLEVLPLYARLSSAEQQRIFSTSKRTRVVVATNVAETSLTVPGVRYVVDVGEARISRFSQRTKVQRLPIEAISQASANQRSGRCGRLGPGIAIRLYAEDDFNQRVEFTEPEIQRTNLASVILTMASQRLGSPSVFPFVDPPEDRAISDGIRLLHELGAVDEPTWSDDRAWLTDKGRALARMPIDPRLGAMVLAGADESCLHEATIIAAALAVQDPRERPRERQQAADEAHRVFTDDRSDLLTLLHLWRAMSRQRQQGTRKQFERWCRDHFLHRQRLLEWSDTVEQLRSAAEEMRLPTTYSHDFDISLGPGASDNFGQDIHRAVLAGLLSQVGMRVDRSQEYLGPRSMRFAIQPGSTCFERKPDWIMAATLVETSRLWARSVAPIDPAWLEEPAAHLTTTDIGEPFWDPESARGGVAETVRLFGLPIIADRTVPLDRHDPKLARELFIQHALIEGDWPGTRYAFSAINASVRHESRNLAVRATQRSFEDEYDRVWQFYDEHLPQTVSSGAGFATWYEANVAADPHLLEMRIADLLTPEESEIDEDRFPNQVEVDGLELAVDYQQASVGVSIDLPIAALGTVDAASFAGVMPGHRREAVEALVRSLPKKLRKPLVPVPETLDTIFKGLTDTTEEAGRFTLAIRQALEQRIGHPLPADALDARKLPAALRPHYRIVDADNVLIAEGHDLDVLEQELQVERNRARNDGAAGVSHPGAAVWDFGTIPRSVEIPTRQGNTTAWPALVDRQTLVGVALMGSAAEQATAMKSGTARLLRLTTAAPLRRMNAHLTNERVQKLPYGPHGGRAEWFEDLTLSCLGAIVDSVGVAWNHKAFEALQQTARRYIADVTDQWAPVAGEMIDEIAEIRLSIAARNQLAPDCVADARLHLDRLAYPGHLSAVGTDRFDDLLRYLQAIRHRLDRLPGREHLDREAMHEVQAVEATFDTIVEHMPWTESIESVAWSLEELRVSLFAQQLGTSEKVSVSRMRRRLAKISAA